MDPYDATLQKLDFDRVRETLASHCAAALGRQLARSLQPSHNAALVARWLDQVREMLTIEERFGLPPLGGVSDIRESLRAARTTSALEPDILARIAETAYATGPLLSWLASVLPAAPSLQALAEHVSDLTPLSTRINHAIGERGQVRDYASPRLQTVRKTIEEAQRQVRKVFDRLLRSASLTRMLQYGSATFHNDRMVLPLKAEYRGRVPGIIHRTSDTGATLFVEPSESVELNNSIVRLREEEQKEITRILSDLTRLVREQSAEMLRTIRAMSALDLIGAKCRYARTRQCICPTIDSNGVVDLHDARHPVLLELFDAEQREGKPPREVVPIDIRLGDDFDVLIVTGPNTGGKTVAIKTVGLLAVMMQCGLPIPAGSGSRLPIFKQVHIDVGDEQSLQQSLSTFSAHLSNQLHILRHTGSRSLVLIDELGAGTDPDEGAAIGRALIGELLHRGAKAIVTTHLSALKAVAYTTPRVDNAAVEFDVQTLRPTYHLRLGEPGNSNALIIAQRLGMTERLVQSAKQFLDDRTRVLNRAIAGTLESRREAERARRAAREAQLEAKRQHDEYERRRQELMQSRQAFDEWTRWISTLEPGDQVYVRTLRKAARIVRMQMQKQKALVTAGAMDIEVPLRDIRALDDSEAEAS